MSRRVIGPLLPAVLAAVFVRGIGAEFIVTAPASLSADAARIRSIDVEDLAGALLHAGLELPAEIHVTLIPRGEARSQAVPDWVAGFAAGERDVVIVPDRVLAYPYDSLESVVRHEVAHLALDARAGGAPLPRWFHEGVATSVDRGWNTAAQFHLLLAMLARPDATELSRLFASSSESDVRLAYLLSARLVHDVRARYGPSLPGRVARGVASGVPFADAFMRETGVTPDAAAELVWAGSRRWTAWAPAVTSPSAAWGIIVFLALLAFVVQRRRRARRRRQWDDEGADEKADGDNGRVC